MIFAGAFTSQILNIVLFAALLYVFFETAAFALQRKSYVKTSTRQFLLFQVLYGVFLVFVSACAAFIVYKLDLDFGFIDISHASVLGQVLILLLISELSFYGLHRYSHKFRIPFISRFHRFHHQITTDMDWVNARKEHVVVVTLFLVIFYFYFFVFFKTDSVARYGTLLLYMFLNALSHFRVLFTIKYLDLFFLFPQDHIKHHTNRSGPYGVSLSVYDTIFDTRE